MQQILPIQSLPAQSFQALLGGQNCSVILQQMSTGLFISLAIAGALIISGRYCNDRVNLIRQAYLGFSGWLYFVDSSGEGSDPQYEGLGSRYLLIYESES